MKTKTAQKKAASPFRFTIRISNGEHEGRKSLRELSYPTAPERWDAADLLNVVRLMAREAAKVQRVKVTQDHISVQFSGSLGGTAMTVSPGISVYAVLPGHPRNSIPSAAIAGLMSVAKPQASADIDIAQLLPVDTDAYLREQRRSLRFANYWKATLERRIAEMGGVR